MATFDENKDTLLKWLQIALELELATIPPYLVALLSIKLPSNREPAELIRSVMIEEMLHLALVANVLNSVGGKPQLNANLIPKYPLRMKFEGKPFHDRDFPIDLAPFGKATIETFLKIEEPQSVAAGSAFQLEINVPALTIGQFYANIGTKLEELEHDSPGKVFVGDEKRQILADYYWSGGGRIVPVKNLATAKAALSIVITQGEGSWTPSGQAEAHFGETFAMATTIVLRK